MAASLLFFFFSPSPSSSSSLCQRHKTSTLFAPPLFTAPRKIPNAVSFRRPFPSIRAAAQVVEERRRVSDDALDISKLGISEHIVSALSRRGITELFPIQRAVLEPAMEGRDMIGRAITGSGKTLAFGIPILDNIIRSRGHQRDQRPSAIVLAPTRELARQVQREFKVSAPTLRSACLYGGIPIMSQVRDLKFGMDIVVGTPGRIIDLVQRGALDLSEVKFVVLDEADQMLAIGFQEDVECILSHLPARKQCMLFSATMPSWVNDISRKHLNNPLVIDLVGDGDQKLADGISLYSVASSNSDKHNLLPGLISKFAQGGKSIIFTKTKKDAETLSNSMRSIIGSRALHGNMQQLQRDKTLAGFRDGRFSVLVATDVAARGLDIPNVDLVVHFEMPNTSEIFIHRSGRTGRAGKEGTTVLLFTRNQRREVKSIERDLGVKFEELHGITGVSDGEGFLYEDAVGDKFGHKFSQPRNVDHKFYETNRQFRSHDNSRKPYSSNNSGFAKASDEEEFPYEDVGARKFGHNFSPRQNFGQRFGERNKQYRSPDKSRKQYSSYNSGITQVVGERFPYQDAVGHRFGHPRRQNVDHGFHETNRQFRGRGNSSKQYSSENSGSRHQFSERSKDPKSFKGHPRHHDLSFENETDSDIFEPLNMNYKKSGRGVTSLNLWK